MPELADIYYDKTIPAYGPGPTQELTRHREVPLKTMPGGKEVLDQLEEVFTRVADTCTEVSPKFVQLAEAFLRLDRVNRQIELANEIGRKCAGNRRRQMRWRK